MRFITLLAVVFCGSIANAATHIWISSDGDFGASTSWNTGKAPSQWLPTDSVLFNGQNQMSVLTGLDQTGVRVASIFFHDQYDGDVGNSGSPLTIAADVFTFNGGYGRLSYRALPTPGRMNFTFLNTYSTGNLIWGEHDFLIIKDGYYSITATAKIQNLIIQPSPNGSASPSVVLQSGGPSIPALRADGGVIDNYRPVAPGHIIRIDRGDLLQIGVMENGSSIETHGGRFTYDPIFEPASPGPLAEFTSGTIDFGLTFYELHFAFGFIGYDANMIANQQFASMGLVNLDTTQPSVSFVDRNDTDSDGFFNVFDECPDTPNYAPDPCSGVTLKDFASFQNAMTGP